ncbi:hypothetical protein [Sphingomonas zeae]|jgi:hypothetical protein
MFFMIVGMMMQAAQPGSGALCEVGRAALVDLPSTNAKNEYVETDPKRSGLMKLCPQLRQSLPNGYVAVNDDARARASQHYPTSAPPPPWAGIYSVDAPVMAADGQSATVAISWECSGPCGSDTVSRYIRTAKGWRREGSPRILRMY